MAYFKSVDLEQIALPSNKDYWVKVLPFLSYGDAKKFAKVNPDGDVDMIGSADIFLSTIIKEWNLDDEDGNVLEVSTENIDKLTQQDALYIINQAGGLVENDQAKKGS